MAEDRYYLGSDLKFKIEITASGFDQATDDYTIDLYCGNKKIAYTKADIVEQDGNYYLLVDTSLLRPGTMKLVITAMVPDDTFFSVLFIDLSVLSGSSFVATKKVDAK